MSKREIKIDAVSWKNRKVLSKGMWIFIDKDIDLKNIIVGNSYIVEVSQLLDGRWAIDKLNVTKDTENEKKK